MKIVTSRDNRLVKEAVELHESKGRKRLKQFMVEGLRSCETFIKAQRFELVHLIVTVDNEEWARSLEPDEKKIVVVFDTVMKKISSATTPSGMCAVFAIPEPVSPKKLTNGIVLAKIQDPGNMGTLIRTATAFGQMVVVVDSVDIFSPKVIQASAGTIAEANLVRMGWNELIDRAKADKLSLVALTVEGGIPVAQFSGDKWLLVVGNEANGLPEEWLAQCNARVTLPMPGGTESMNAAVAGSIALYAFTQK